MFVQKLGKNPPSQKPFWQRINRIRGKSATNEIPTLVVNDIKYSTDKEKSEVFAQNLQQLFCPAQESFFDETFKSRVDEKVKNHDFSKHRYLEKDIRHQRY